MSKHISSCLEECTSICPSVIKILIKTIPNLEIEKIYFLMLKWASLYSKQELEKLYCECVPLFKIKIHYFKQIISLYEDTTNKLFCISFILSNCLQIIKTQEEYEIMVEFILLFSSKSYNTNTVHALNKMLNNCGTQLFSNFSFKISTKLLSLLISNFNEITNRDINFGLKNDSLYSFIDNIYSIHVNRCLRPILAILNTVFYSDLVHIISPYIEISFTD